MFYCFDLNSPAYTFPRMTREPPQGHSAPALHEADEAVRKEEADRLKKIYQDRKRSDPGLNQERIADLCGWAGQSVVSQYMNAKIGLNLPALLKFASILAFDPVEVSPRLVEQFSLVDSPKQPQPSSTQATTSRIVLDPIEVWDDETPLGADEVEIPFFQEVEVSAGTGSAVMLETNGRKLRFGKRTLQRKNVDPMTAGCVPVKGNSMEPVLPDGSTVGVNTDAKSVIDGKMYALDHDGLLRVKLLYRLPGGGLRLRSYNSSEHPDEHYEGPYWTEHIRIIGQVFWYSVLL
ncbi:Transcriptional regulator [Pseudomonas chlororaphis subsp. piscium]|uniref:Transcriptional regulator n=2 Tax=Pseudomonas chlororaphis TaxID=587753 RepID=A0AAX3G1Z1_9PSED|nr:Transcriptional regulator [Pseudomonas chlororaphis subsp. piscium]AZC42436.1 Transcriptional regulator [Pseudomonas chlororaphis subsp. piscium]VEF76812.1 transcriptional regulator [Pseudomonas chlororaphis]